MRGTSLKRASLSWRPSSTSVGRVRRIEKDASGTGTVCASASVWMEPPFSHNVIPSPVQLPGHFVSLNESALGTKSNCSGKAARMASAGDCISCRALNEGTGHTLAAWRRSVGRGKINAPEGTGWSRRGRPAPGQRVRHRSWLWWPGEGMG